MKKLLFILSVFLLGFATYEPETTGRRELTTLKSIMFPEKVNAFAAVQTAADEVDPGTSLDITLSSTTQNNLVVVSIVIEAADNVSSVTDNQSNSYTVGSAVTVGGGLPDVKVYQAYGIQTTGGVTQVTINTSGSTLIVACADEYSGNATSSVLDVSGTGSGTGTSVAASTFTPSASGKLIVASLCGYISNSWTAGSGYTLYGNGLYGATYPLVRSQYKLSGTTSETAPATTSYFTGDGYAEIARAYNPAAAAVTPTPVLSAVGNEPSFFDFTPKNKTPK